MFGQGSLTITVLMLQVASMKHQDNKDNDLIWSVHQRLLATLSDAESSLFLEDRTLQQPGGHSLQALLTGAHDTFDAEALRLMQSAVESNHRDPQDPIAQRDRLSKALDTSWQRSLKTTASRLVKRSPPIEPVAQAAGSLIGHSSYAHSAPLPGFSLSRSQSPERILPIIRTNSRGGVTQSPFKHSPGTPNLEHPSGTSLFRQNSRSGGLASAPASIVGSGTQQEEVMDASPQDQAPTEPPTSEANSNVQEQGSDPPEKPPAVSPGKDKSKGTRPPVTPNSEDHTIPREPSAEELQQVTLDPDFLALKLDDQIDQLEHQHDFDEIGLKKIALLMELYNIGPNGRQLAKNTPGKASKKLPPVLTRKQKAIHEKLEALARSHGGIGFLNGAKCRGFV